MNYVKLYDNLVKNALGRESVDCYTENHHIRPRCIGGKDDLSNMVSFTAREHFMAHWLLTKIYKDTRYSNIMLKAFTAMNMQNSEQDRKITSHKFEILRKAYVKASSGEGNPMYGAEPHNIGKKAWYIPSKDTHVYSVTKPSKDAILGRKVINKGRVASAGNNNGMSGNNIYKQLPKEAVSSMMDKRRETFYNKSEEELESIRLAKSFGYEFSIDGEKFPTMSHVESRFGLKHKSIAGRCKSNKFPAWIRTPRKSRYKVTECS